MSNGSHGVPGKPNHPMEYGSLTNVANFEPEGPRPFYPPVCLGTHWDPTKIIQRTLPTDYVPQALDPRPWTKVCLEYVTAGDGGAAAPSVAEDTVLPMGGKFYPTSRYSEAIDAESALRRMDRPLGTCDDDQFYPNKGGDMYNQRILVPHHLTTDPSKISELALPRVARSIKAYECRERDDVLNASLSGRRFNNATKQDKYALIGKV